MIDFWLTVGTMAIEGSRLQNGLYQTIKASVPAFIPTLNSGFFENNTIPTNPPLPLPHYGRVPAPVNPATLGDPLYFRAALRSYLGTKWKTAAPPVSNYTASKLCQLWCFESQDATTPVTKALDTVQPSLSTGQWAAVEAVMIGLALIDGDSGNLIKAKDPTIVYEFNLDSSAALEPISSWMTSISGAQALQDAQTLIARGWGSGCGERMLAYPNVQQIVP